MIDFFEINELTLSITIAVCGFWSSSNDCNNAFLADFRSSIEFARLIASWLSLECSSNVRLLFRLIGGLDPMFKFNEGIGKIMENGPDGNFVAFGVGVDGADAYSRV